MSIIIYAPKGIAIKSLCRVFDHSGLSYDACHDPEHCINLAQSNHYNVVIMIHTGALDELLHFYKRWKQTAKQAAFIVLSQRQSALERVEALRAGVNSYHITPFSYTQLVMDVAQYEYLQENNSHIVEAHGFSADFVSRTIKFQGKYLRLTKKQFDLMTLFLRHPGKIFSRVQIWEHLWNDGDYPLANTVDVHINRLRKALPAPARKLIETVYGFGYRIQPRS